MATNAQRPRANCRTRANKRQTIWASATRLPKQQNASRVFARPHAPRKSATTDQPPPRGTPE
eukprot:466251-Lingulodinium_polyedra.AAC.1